MNGIGQVDLKKIENKESEFKGWNSEKGVVKK